MMEGLRSAVKTQPDQDVKKIFNFRKDIPALMVMNAMSSPSGKADYVGVDSIMNSLPMGSTVSAANLLASIQLWVFGASKEALFPTDPRNWTSREQINGFIERSKMGPKQRKFWKRFWLKQAAGELATANTTFELAGLAGSPIVENWMRLKDDSRPLNRQRLVQSFLATVAGGTVARAADVLVAGGHELGLLDVDDPAFRTLSKRSKDVGLKQAETFVRYAVRQVTGVGWNLKEIDLNKKRYFSTLKSKWKAATWGPLEKQAEQFKALGQHERAAELMMNAKRLEKIITREVEAMKREADDFLKNL